MKARALAALALLTQSACAAAAPTRPSEHGCFSGHVREALAVNEARRPHYAASTAGASLAVSDRLIAWERASLLAAVWFDAAARPYQEQGVPLLCAEFVSMHDLPQVDSSARSAEPPRVDGAALRRELTRRLRHGGFEGLARATAFELRQLADAPNRHCLVRHLLESMRRAALLAPRHAEEAAARGLPDPRSLSRAFIRAHLATLDAATDLDHLAISAHRRGAPILCADLPHIPPPVAEPSPAARGGGHAVSGAARPRRAPGPARRPR